MRPMSNLKSSSPELYSEAEAAVALGISISRLHELLDRYVFTGDNKRPQPIDFTASDLLLLGYWNNLHAQPAGNNVIRMPKRS